MNDWRWVEVWPGVWAPVTVVAAEADGGCAHARLESEFFQTGSAPDASVDMAYWCPDCGQDFEDDPTMVEAETRLFSNKALGLITELGFPLTAAALRARQAARATAGGPAAQVEADERFVFDAADLPF